MDTCPHCHRKLISHLSERCNWCGEVIPDAEYQQNAQTERKAFFLHDRLEAQMESARLHALSFDSYGPGMSILPPLPNYDQLIAAPPNTRPAPPVPTQANPQTYDQLNVPPPNALPTAPATANAQSAETADSPGTECKDKDETDARFGHLEL